MITPSQKLIQIAAKHGTDELGVSAEQIERIDLTEEVVSALSAGLEHDSAEEVRWALFFCSGFALKSQSLQHVPTIWEIVKRKLPTWIKAPDARLRSEAVPLFIHLREAFPCYREGMLKCLADPEPTVRRLALLNGKTFLQQQDLPALIRFETDDFATEVFMHSHLVYVLRNEALDLIEYLLGKRFRKFEVAETKNGQVFVWFDWTPLKPRLQKR